MPNSAPKKKKKIDPKNFSLAAQIKETSSDNPKVDAMVAAKRDRYKKEGFDAKAHIASLSTTKKKSKNKGLSLENKQPGTKPEVSRNQAGSEPEATRKQPGTKPEVPRKYPGSTGEQSRKQPGTEPERNRAGSEPEVSQNRNRAGSDQEPSRNLTSTKKERLTGAEAIVYEWLVFNEIRRFFTARKIAAETCVSAKSVRKILKSLENKQLINLSGYNPSERLNQYSVNPQKVVEVVPNSTYFSIRQKMLRAGSEPEVSHPGTGTEPSRNRAGSEPEPEVSRNRACSYKIDRQILYNKSICLSEFWKKEGLTEKRIYEWLFEPDFNFSEEDLATQLLFGENEPKVREARSPVNYFRKCLLDGGLTRPDGYKLPEEQRLEWQTQELEAARARIAKAEQVQKEQAVLARKHEWHVFLEDKVQVDNALKAIEEGHVTAKLRISIKTYRDTGAIGERLLNRLKMWFDAD